MDDSYMAGIVDGEGCIRLSSSRNGVATVQMEVTMSYKALPLLKKIQATYGGNCIRIKRDPRPSRATTHSWRLIGRPCTPLLQRLLPHLLIKQPQAELAIWFQDKVDSTPRGPGKGGPWTEELRTTAARARARMAELNRTGPERQGIPGKTPMAFLEGSSWVSPQMSLDPLPAPFDGPWPMSGAVVDGMAYAMPSPNWTELAAPLLGTPRCSDGMAHPLRSGVENARGRLEDQVSLLPTPTARDWKGANQRGDTSCLPGALLPTPQARDGDSRGASHPDRRKALNSKRSGQLDEVVIHLLPTPTVGDSTGGGVHSTARVSTATRHAGVTLRTALLELSTGGSSVPRSDGGSASSDAQPRRPPSADGVAETS